MSKPVIVYVTYHKKPNYRFDKEYYLKSHIPLVTHTWQSCGLISAVAFFPEGNDSETVAMCELRFVDEKSFTTALNAPDTVNVMNDVINYTDLPAIISQSIELHK